jgi:hypothetical protein
VLDIAQTKNNRLKTLLLLVFVLKYISLTLCTVAGNPRVAASSMAHPYITCVAHLPADKVL